MGLTVEIRKAGFTNKGAAMMLIAATREVQSRLPGSRVAMAADYSASYEARARLGIWHRAELMRGGIDVLGPVISRVPAKLRERYGFVTEAEVNVVLDAAGFAYSDQWGLATTLDFSRRARRWKKEGKKLVLLPQAFGPFNMPGMREAIQDIADCADLIFAREPASYSYLVEAVGERSNIRIAPDFTNMLTAVPSQRFSKGSGMVAIVPNVRMLDKADASERGCYLDFLVHVVAIARRAGLKPFTLVHETVEDSAVAERLNSMIIGETLEVIHADDPLVAKGIIAQCDLMVGSRFHALISALSQAVPVIGTGWSHKYRELFASYGYPKGLTRVDLDEAGTAAVLASVLTPQGRATLSAQLEIAARRLKEDASEMWDQVFRTIELGTL